MLLATIASIEPLYRPTTTGPGASRSLPDASEDPGASVTPLAAGGACIPRRNISERSASLAVRVSESASAAIFSSSPSSKLAYNSASRPRSFSSSICPIVTASYPRQPDAASFLFECVVLEFLSIFISAPYFFNISPFPAPDPHPLNSAQQTLNPQLFQHLPAPFE